MGLGILCYLGLENEPTFYIMCCATLFTFTLSIFIFYYRQNINFFIPSICILFFSFGFTRIYWETYFSNPNLIKTFEKNVTFNAEVIHSDFTSQKIPRYTLKIHQWIQSPEQVKKIKKVRLKFSKRQDLQPGDIIECLASLTPIGEPASPWSHNFKRDLFFQGIEALGSMKNCTILKSYSTFQRIRSSLNHTLQKKLSFATAPIAMALITGEKSKIESSIREDYVKSGLAHVLAISGLHMGLIASLIFFVVKRGIGILHLFYALPYTFPLKKVAAISSIGFTFLYLMISGMGIPALRSFCMTLILMIGIVVSRNPISLRSLTFAAIFIFLFFPSALFSVSFQLSFAAVIALVSAYEKGSSRLISWFYQLIDKRGIVGKIYAFIMSIVLSSIIATMSTTPISMAVFNQFTLHSITGNILVLPLLSFWIMPSILLCMLSLLWGGSDFIFKFCDYGIQYMNHAASWVSQLPGSEINIASPHMCFLPLYFIGLCILCIGPHRNMRLIGCLLILSSGAMHYFHTLPIGYISQDRASMGFYEHPYFYTTHSKRSEFTTQQWIQNLGIPLKLKREITTPLWKWKYFHILILPTYRKQQEVLDRYPNLLENSNQYLPLISNGYVKKKLKTSKKTKFKRNHMLIVDAEDLKSKGSAFIFSNGDIQFSNEFKKNRPWDF